MLMVALMMRPNIITSMVARIGAANPTAMGIIACFFPSGSGISRLTIRTYTSKLSRNETNAKMIPIFFISFVVQTGDRIS